MQLKSPPLGVRKKSNILAIASTKFSYLFFGLLLSLFTITPWQSANAQLDLGPHIGPNSEPPGSSPICVPPFYFGTFDTSGFVLGDTVFNFTYFDINGDSINLQELLLSHKYCLLVSGSYTCPQFRDKCQILNQIQEEYDSLINILVIYTLEAHPDIDLSAYTGTVDVVEQNIFDSINYRQPSTYAERIAIATDMLSDTNLNIQFPVFLDDPCNSFWNTFGPAPVNAYLIHPYGRVSKKHDFFDMFPNSIMCDLEFVFHISTGSCIPSYTSGELQWIPGESDTVFGSISSTIIYESKIYNNSDSTLVLQIEKEEVPGPHDWSSSVCMSVCYPPSYDDFTTYIGPYDTVNLHVYFYSPDTISAHGTYFTLTNLDDTGEFISFTAYAATQFEVADTSEDDTIISNLTNAHGIEISVYPNPGRERLHLVGLQKGMRYQLVDALGRVWIEEGTKTSIETAHLASGMYFLIIDGSQHQLVKKIMLE